MQREINLSQNIVDILCSLITNILSMCMKEFDAEKWFLYNLKQIYILIHCVLVPRTQ